MRTHLTDIPARTADTRCQTSQAMAIFYGVFDESEQADAFSVLLNVIEEDGRSMDVGILGARVLFHVLSQFGRSELAFYMIAKPEWPSYGHFIKQGLTAIPESFVRDGGEWDSRNHHMFCDISNWFITRLAGLGPVQDCGDTDHIRFQPAFIPSVPDAAARYLHKKGAVSCAWKREGDRIELRIELPESCEWELTLPEQFSDEGEWFFRIQDRTEEKEDGVLRLTVSIRRFLIRKMTLRDEEGVKRFYRSLGEEAAFYFNNGGGNEARTMQFFAGGKPDHLFHVVSTEGEIAALAFLWDLDSGVPWFGIGVGDPYRHLGVGSALLAQQLALCGKRGFGGMLLRTHKNNLAAQKLYERFGFERLGEHPSGEYLYIRRYV